MIPKLFLASLTVVLLAAAKPEDGDTPEFDADLKSLVGDWELAKKDDNPKLRLRFPGEKEKNGALTIYNDDGTMLVIGIAIRIEKKADKKTIIVRGFSKESDPILPYRIDGKKLTIESGKAVFDTKIFKGSVLIKGAWERVKK